MKKLFRCLWHLGLNRGWRYWKIQRLCERDPSFASAWADSLESEAASHEANGVTQYVPYLRAFAAEIREHAKRWETTTPISVNYPASDMPKDTCVNESESECTRERNEELARELGKLIWVNCELRERLGKLRWLARDRKQTRAQLKAAIEQAWEESVS